MDVTRVPSIAGALLFTPTPHVDERGFFCRTFDAGVVRAAGIDPSAFAQVLGSPRPPPMGLRAARVHRRMRMSLPALQCPIPRLRFPANPMALPR